MIIDAGMKRHSAEFEFPTVPLVHVAEMTAFEHPAIFAIGVSSHFLAITKYMAAFILWNNSSASTLL
jgi:hypothetical protein